MCNGEVETLVGSVVTLTGKVSLRGRRTLRSEVIDKIRWAGGMVKADASGRVDIVVHGDLGNQRVVDEIHHYSQKLEFVVKAMASGRHMCVVTSSGLSQLVDGGTATCHTQQVVKLATSTC